MQVVGELEKSWTKTQILEAYLNLVFFRGGLQGIAAAARGLFDKTPHGLDDYESLLLAALIRSPNAIESRNYGIMFPQGLEIGLPRGSVSALPDTFPF